MRPSLAAKFSIVLLATATTAFGASILTSVLLFRSIATSSADAAQDEAERAIGEALRREGNVLSAAFARDVADDVVDYDFDALQIRCRELGESKDIASVEVINAEGILLGDGTSRPASRVVSVAHELSNPKGANFREEPGRLVVSRGIWAGDRRLGSVALALDAQPMLKARSAVATRMEQMNRAGEQQLLWVSLISASAFAALASIMAIILGRRLAQPILALKRAADDVSRGSLDVQVPATSSDEVGALTKSFNGMVQQLASNRDELREQARMARELEIASSLQLALLPALPKHHEFEFAGRMIAAHEVGGDFYDVLSDSASGSLWLTIGDVSGHGLKSGLIMLMAQSAFATTMKVLGHAPPAEVLDRVNQVLYQNIVSRLQGNQYVTAQLLIHRGSGKFSCAGAHQPLLVYRAEGKKCDVFEPSGPWLGIIEKLPEISTIDITLEPNDVMILYTDGIIEARNELGNEFGLDAFKRSIETILAECDDLDVVVEQVLAQVDEHCPERDDDRTLLLVRRRAIFL